MFEEAKQQAQQHPFALVPLPSSALCKSADSFLSEGCWYLYSKAAHKPNVSLGRRAWNVASLFTEQEFFDSCMNLLPDVQQQLFIALQNGVQVSDQYFHGERQLVDYPFLALQKHLQLAAPHLLKCSGIEEALHNIARILKSHEPLKNEKLVYNGNYGNFCLLSYTHKDTENSEQIGKQLLAQGAVFKKYDMAVPRYNSWASVVPGTVLQLKRPEFLLQWVLPKPLMVQEKPIIDSDVDYKFAQDCQSICFLADEDLWEEIYTEVVDILDDRSLDLGPLLHEALKQSSKKVANGDVRFLILAENTVKSGFLAGYRTKQCQRANREKNINSVADDFYQQTIGIRNFGYLDKARIRAFAKAYVKLLFQKARLKYSSYNFWKFDSIAPFSERGKISVQLAPGVDIKDVLLQLDELGFSPWKKFSQTIGPLNDIHSDYRQNRSLQLNLPPDHCVLHGMTGVYSVEDAKKRFEQIVGVGGLLSYSERRRYNIFKHSMSPLGDLASGIDWGVPCTISKRPNYGKLIVFVMKPNILKREHVFFSDRDYGGGKDRHLYYNHYAKSLGQENFYSPPNHRSRQLHINKLFSSHGISQVNGGDGPSQLNEAWFRWMIRWDEIAAVLVSSQGDLDVSVRAMVKQAQTKNILPADLGVYTYDHYQNNLQKEEFEDSVAFGQALAKARKQIYVS